LNQGLEPISSVPVFPLPDLVRGLSDGEAVHDLAITQQKF